MRPAATAGWKGAPEEYVSHCLRLMIAVISSGRAVIQPIFQPVTEKVLPAEEIDTVRSFAPGSVAIGRCAGPKVRCS